ncbi:MAG: HAD-IIIA family hydrolase [Elusimicrobiales bacterium]|nr:HAD-IIIA family hydrolase [Elusimicrobiales bacterium]
MGIGKISRAVFLDRDGVINALALNPDTGQWESPHRPEDARLLDGAAQALKDIAAAGYLIFVVSNQPSFAKGKTSLENLRLVHDKLEAELSREGARVERFCYCYHHPQGVVEGYSKVCDCRKPGAYFLLEVQREYNLDLRACWMAGDRDSDVECGRAAGVRTILVTGSPDGARRGASEPDFTARDLKETAEIISKHKGDTI